MSEWFPLNDSPRAGSSRANTRRSIRRNHRNRQSSGSTPAQSLPRNTSFERYQNAVHHPDSVGASSGPNPSGASRRFSNFPVAAPDTPLHLQYNQVFQRKGAGSSAISNNPGERSTHLHSFEGQNSIYPDTPVDYNVGDAPLPEQCIAGNASSTFGRQSSASRSSRGSLDRNSLPASAQSFTSDAIQMMDSVPSLTTQHSLAPARPPDDHPLLQRAPKKKNSRFDGNRTNKDSFIPWSKRRRGDIQKPRLVSEQNFKSKLRQVKIEGSHARRDKSQSAEPEVDPPLYDNLPDKLRQMTVDVWLLRAKIAYLSKDWNAMENHGQQAQELAGDLQYEPFIAKCAFPIGVALFKQKKRIVAYEKFEEAERTRGYYIPRGEILYWMEKANTKLPGERTPYTTPLHSVAEEQEEPPSSTAQAGVPAMEKLSLSQLSAQVLDSFTGIGDPPTSVSSPIASLGANRTPKTEANPSLRGPDPIKPVAPGQVNDSEPIRPNQLPTQHRKITKLRTPLPASLGMARRYNPDLPRTTPSPPPTGENSPQFRSRLIMGQTHPASNLSEMVLPDAAFQFPGANGTAKSSSSTGSHGGVRLRSQSASSAGSNGGVRLLSKSASSGSASGGVRLPGWAIPESEQADKEPPKSAPLPVGDRHPNQLSQVKELSRGSNGDVRARQQQCSPVSSSGNLGDPYPEPDSAALSTKDFSAPVENVRRNSLAGMSETGSPSGSTSPQSETRAPGEVVPVESQPPPSSAHQDAPHQDPAALLHPTQEQPPPPSIQLEDEEAVRHLRSSHDLQMAEIENKIQDVMTIASTRVRSARSAGASRSSRPPWARSYSAGGSIYDPTSRTAPGGRQFSRESFRGGGSRVAVGSSRVEGSTEAPRVPARPGPRIIWEDGWEKGKDAGVVGSERVGKDVGLKEKSENENVSDHGKVNNKSKE
ncbi:MAG: hypothetical protein Q9219_002754 [cf. Caloplaca sp. 3 TL-2023]